MPINWNVSIKAEPSNPANWLVAAIYDATAPNVVVDFKVLPKPYGDTKNVSFLSLEFIVYDFKLYESPTPTVSGTVLNTFSFQPAQGTITTIREDLVLTAGITPDFDVDATSYTNDALKNWVYDIERRGFGTMEKNVDYRLTLDGVPEDSIAANGWELLNDGDVFGDQEKFILHFQPQVTAANTGGGGGGGGNLIVGVAVLNNDIALDNSYMKKMCLLQGGLGVTHFTVTLPPLSSVGENQQIGFVSEGGNHVSATLDAAGAEVINFCGAKPDINMTQGEEIWFIKTGGAWYVLFADGNFKTVGQIVDSYFTIEPNCLFTNGSLVSRTDYGRLWKRIQPIAVADTQWNVTQNINGRTVYVNRGKFTTGDGAATFRLPMLYTVGNRKMADGATRLAGSFEADQVGQFTGEITILQGNSFNGSPGTPGATRVGRGSASPNDLIINQIFNTGLETREANFGIYALVRY